MAKDMIKNNYHKIIYSISTTGVYATPILTLQREVNSLWPQLKPFRLVLSVLFKCVN